MALSERDVRGIADYARIALTDEELTEMTAYMNGAITGVLKPVLQYGEADVPPTFHPIGDLSNVMGADVADDPRALPIDVALSNAGAFRDRYFRVPSILGAEGGDR